jgi:hypothetical protein
MPQRGICFPIKGKFVSQYKNIFAFFGGDFPYLGKEFYSGIPIEFSHCNLFFLILRFLRAPLTSTIGSAPLSFCGWHHACLDHRVRKESASLCAKNGEAFQKAKPLKNG